MVGIFEDYGSMDCHDYRLRGSGELSFGKNNDIICTAKDGCTVALMYLDEINSGYWRIVPIGEIEYYKDTVGGIHDEGLGWNPNGGFCGECSVHDCSKCGVWEQNQNTLL